MASSIHLELNYTLPNVLKEAAASVLSGERVERRVHRQTPHLNVAISWPGDEMLLVWINGQAFNRIVVCLEENKSIMSILPISSLSPCQLPLTWNRCRNSLWRTSKIHTSPFLPADIINWCCGAYTTLEAPWSWQVNAKRKNPSIQLHDPNHWWQFLYWYSHATKAFFWGRSVSHMPTFLFSELCPAVR